MSGELTHTRDTRAASLRKALQRPETVAQFAAAMPSVGLTPQRFVRAALTACTLNPRLYDCTPESMMRVLIVCAQYGLTPTGKNGMYLIPFNNSKKDGRGNWTKQLEVQGIIDYRGLLQIARRSGEVMRITAGIVRDGDVFDYEEGSRPFLRHRVAEDGDSDREVTHVFAIAHLKGAMEMPVFRVLTRRDIQRFRSRSKAPNSPAWSNDWEAMAMKTALRRLIEGGHVPLQDGDHRLIDLMQSEDQGMDLKGPGITDLGEAEVVDPPPAPTDMDELKDELARSALQKKPQADPPAPEDVDDPAADDAGFEAHKAAQEAGKDPPTGTLPGID